MIEEQGNVWLSQKRSDWIVILTNGSVNNKGQAIMGKGIALEAAQRFHNLPAQLGIRLKYDGNTVQCFPEYGLFTFPTKQEWYEPSNLKLIGRSCTTLVNMVSARGLAGRILIPRPGCGNGKLTWHQVKPVCTQHFRADKYVIFSRN